MQREWKLRDCVSDESSLIKRILISRGIKKEEDIYEFLHPLEMKLSDPYVFSDMQKTVIRIVSAIENNEKIIVYGDFDVDGITSTSLLVKTLRFLGANVNYFIPHREKEGHGFDEKSIIPLIINTKPKIIITVDCGISNTYEIDIIKSFNIDVIITDHHEAPKTLPNAFAIINPKSPNSLNESLSIKKLEHLTSFAGVGVVFKLATALLQHFNKTEFIYEILPFVAVGTIADIVPLIGENRYFVKKGLELIKNHFGFKKLLESCGYNIENEITAENIAFGVAPRINASGRLDTVEDALKIMLSDNQQEIIASVMNLNELNRIRQELCQQTFIQADEIWQKDNMNNPVIVLFNENWLVGIVGIVASKLVEKYYKPVFLMTYNKEKNEYHCSARGIEGLSIYDIISANSDIINGGGHKLAGGFSFSKEKTSFEDVKKSLINTVTEMLNGKKLKPFLNIDLEINPKDITFDLINEISELAPFGASNPNPVFAMKDLKVNQKFLMGEDKKHLKISATKDGFDFNCIRWSMGDISLVKNDIFDLAFHPQINNYKGENYIQLIIDDIHNKKLKEQEICTNKLTVFDHRNKTDILPLVADYVKNSKQKIIIFAESKSVKDLLSPFKILYEKISNRQQIEKCDCLIFFDYPADKTTFDNIVKLANPSAIHFMKYDIKYCDNKELIETFIKMLRFACNNNDGKVDLLRCASALGKSFEVIYLLLDILEENDFIKIIEKNSVFYKIDLLNVKDMSKLLNNEKIKNLQILTNKCESFQKSILENDLSTLELE